MNSLPMKLARDEYSTKWGLNEKLVLAIISLVMDFITLFPPDLVYSEY